MKNLALALVAAIGGVLLIWATPAGLAISNDTASYFGMAASIRAGCGIAVNGSPVVQFPPFYAVVLASLPTPTLVSLRWLNALLFGATALTIGWGVGRVTGKEAAAALAAAAVILVRGLLPAFASALSEPVAIPLLLGGLWLLGTGLDNDSDWRQWAGASAFAVAILTRYALLPAAAVAILMVLRARKPLARSAALGAFALAPFTLWLVRNSIVTSTVTGRTIAWHPATAAVLIGGVRTFRRWLYPSESLPLGAEVILGAAAMAGAIFLVVRAIRRSASSAIVGAGFFVALYVPFVLLTNFVADSSTPLDARLFLPVTVLMIAIALSVIPIRRVTVIVCLALLVLQGAATVHWARVTRGAQIVQTPGLLESRTAHPGACRS